MRENSIAISLLVQGLQDDALGKEQRALLEAYQEDLLHLFQNTGSPSKKWVAEIVALAITENEGQYRKILDNYLMFLQKEERIVEEYHIQGLADILSLAQNPSRITASHGEQILSLLLNEKKNRLLNPANKDIMERYQCLSLWQQILFVLTDADTEIQEAQKESLRRSFKAYETSFKSNDEVGLSLVALAQQSLLHVKGDRAPLWKRAGMKALSTAKNLTLSAAALGALPVTFGLSGLGAITPAAEAISDITQLAKDIYRHIQEKKETNEWYQEHLKLRSLFILSIYYQQETQFQNLIQGFINLYDKQLKLSVAYGLLDTVKQILISWPGEAHKKYHEQCYLFVQDCLNNLDDKALVTRLFSASMELMKESSVNESFIALWVEYIAKNEPLFTHLPLTTDFIKSMGIFYQILARIKLQSKNDSLAQLKWTELQKILISRLVAGCTNENNATCLEALCLLEFDESIEDKNPVNHELEVIQAQIKDKLESARQDAKHQLQIENAQPSLMLIEWTSLPEEKQRILATIFNRYGMDILVDASSKKSPALFREVKNLIIVSYVGKNAIHVENLPETEGGRKTLQMLLKWKAHRDEKGAQETPQFAEKVGFTFIAHYVDGFKQGINKSLIKEALRLARELGAGQKLSLALQDHLAMASFADASSVARPFRSSVALKKADKGGMSAEENLDWIRSDKVGNRYVVKINYDEGLSKDEARALQELLQGNSGLKAATQKGEFKTNEDGDYITEISFSSEKSANNLIAQAKELIAQMQLQLKSLGLPSISSDTDGDAPIIIEHFGDKYYIQSTKEYSSEEIAEYQQKLKKYYQSKEYARVQLLDDEEPSSIELNDIFVNLVIVKEEEQKKYEQENLSKTTTFNIKNEERSLGLLNNHEDIHQVKQSIELKDLFKPRKILKKLSDGTIKEEDKKIKRLLLLGRAGIGKSTLCRHLAWQWAKGELLIDFDWVFHINLKEAIHDFDNSHGSMALNHLLFLAYGTKGILSEDMTKDLERLIGGQQQKVLFLLDGYDEVAHLNHPLIEKTLLSQPYYLLTSRPYAIQTKRNTVDDVLENVGLLQQDIDKYINNYFTHRHPNEEAKLQLNNWLKKQTAVHSMCIIPIYLELLCNIWVEKRTILEVQTQIQPVNLYTLLMEKLFKRMLGRSDPQNLNSYQQIAETHLHELTDIILAKSYLAQLAIEGIKSGRLLISGQSLIDAHKKLRHQVATDNKEILILPEDYEWKLNQEELRRKINSIDLIKQLIKSGFLKNIGDSEDASKNSYYFLHLTFQEYFAALYLSQNLEAQKDFIVKHKYDPSWQLVWTLVAGLLKNDGIKLTQFFRLLLEEPRDLWGQYEAILLAECLESCGWSEKLDVNLSQKFINYLQEWIKKCIEKNVSAFYRMAQLSRTMEVLKVQQLLNDLYMHSERRIRSSIMISLGYLKNLGQSGIDLLIKPVHSRNDGQVLECAAITLTNLESPGLQTLDALLSYVNSKDEYTKQVVIRALSNVINKIQPTQAVIDTLQAACNDPDNNVRWAAIESLGMLKDSTVNVIDILLDLYQSYEDSHTRGIVIGSLSKTLSSDERVLNLLLTANTSGNDMWVRCPAITALGKLLKPTHQVIESLIEAAKDKDPNIYIDAVEALGNLSKSDSEVARTLLHQCAARGIGEIYRYQPREALIKLAANFSEDAIAILMQEGCNSGDRYIRAASYEALIVIAYRNESYLSKIIERCDMSDEFVYARVLRALGKFPKFSEEVISFLIHGWENQNYQNESFDSVRYCAIAAMVELKSSDPRICSILLKGCEKTHESPIRRVAIKGLDNMVYPSEDIITALLSYGHEKESDGYVRGAALEILSGLSDSRERNREVGALLVKGCQSGDDTIRSASIKGIEKFCNLLTPDIEVINTLLKVLSVLKRRFPSITVPAELPLRVICTNYPTQTNLQDMGQKVLERSLIREFTAITQLPSGEFKVFINRSCETFCSMNLNQLKSAIEQLRWVPLSFLNAQDIDFFTDSRSMVSSSTSAPMLPIFAGKDTKDNKYVDAEKTGETTITIGSSLVSSSSQDNRKNKKWLKLFGRRSNNK